MVHGEAGGCLRVSVHKRGETVLIVSFLTSSAELNQNTFCIFFWNQRLSFGSKVDLRHYLRKKLIQSSIISFEGSWFILYFQQSVNQTHNRAHPLSSISGTKPVLEAIVVRGSLHACVLWLSASQGQEVFLYQMFSMSITPRVIFTSLAHSTAQRAWCGRNSLADDCYFILLFSMCVMMWDRLRGLVLHFCVTVPDTGPGR